MKLRQHIININLPYNLKEFVNLKLTDEELKDGVQGFHFIINSNIDENIECKFGIKSGMNIFNSFDLIDETYMDTNYINFLINKAKKIDFYIYFKKIEDLNTKNNDFEILYFEILKKNNYELTELLIPDNLTKNNNFNIIFQFSPKYHFDIYRYHLVLYLSNMSDKEHIILKVINNSYQERKLEKKFINFLVTVHKNLISESKDIFVFNDYKDDILKLIKKFISVGTNRYQRNTSSVILSEREKIFFKNKKEVKVERKFKINNQNLNESNETQLDSFNCEIRMDISENMINTHEEMYNKNIFGNNFVQYKISIQYVIKKPFISIILYAIDKQEFKFIESIKNIVNKNFNTYFEILIFNTDIKFINLLKGFVKSLFKKNLFLISISFIIPNKKIYKLVDQKYSLLQELIILSNVSESKSNFLFLINSNSIWNQKYITESVKVMKDDNKIHLILSCSAKTYFPSNGKIENYTIEKNNFYEKYQQCIFPIINKNILVNMNPNLFIFSKINKIIDIRQLLDSIPNKKIYFIENNSLTKNEDFYDLHIFE